MRALHSMDTLLHMGITAGGGLPAGEQCVVHVYYGSGSTSVTPVTRSKCLVIFATCAGALQA